MFQWFIKKYDVMTAEEREENWQRMAANWQPADGFEQLVTKLFLGVSYASAARVQWKSATSLTLAYA
jgi:hypothetical protein